MAMTAAERQRKYRIDHPDRTGAAWYAKHRDSELMRGAVKRLAHPEYRKGLYAKNRDAAIAYSLEWAKKNPDRVRINQAAWVVANPEKVRNNVKRMQARRRDLGFVPMNTFSPGSEAHHLNQNDVIYIPHELHRSVYHNVLTGRGMAKINAKALVWYAENRT
jgi:hypothetical protein